MFEKKLLTFEVDNPPQNPSIFGPGQNRGYFSFHNRGVRPKSPVGTLHIGPARGHMRKLTVVKNRGTGLKFAAIEGCCQSISLKNYPIFYVKNIFLAQKLTKWEGFYKSIRKSMKI